MRCRSGCATLLPFPAGVATDVVLFRSSKIDERRSRRPGRGSSSSKRITIARTIVRPIPDSPSIVCIIKLGCRFTTLSPRRWDDGRTRGRMGVIRDTGMRRTILDSRGKRLDSTTLPCRHSVITTRTTTPTRRPSIPVHSPAPADPHFLPLFPIRIYHSATTQQAQNKQHTTIVD